jgi:hypothetical protein
MSVVPDNEVPLTLPRNVNFEPQLDSNHCFWRLNEAVSVAGPRIALRDVMSAVPLSVVPLTLPWNVISTDAIGKLFWPENVKESLDTTPEVIGTWTRPACGGVKTSVPVMASPFWFSVSSAGPCHLCPRLSVDSIDPFQTPETSWRNTQPASEKMAKARTIGTNDNGLSRIFIPPLLGTSCRI